MMAIFVLSSIRDCPVFCDHVYSGVLQWVLPEAIPIPADVIVQQTRLINTLPNMLNTRGHYWIPNATGSLSACRNMFTKLMFLKLLESIIEIFWKLYSL